MRDAFSVPFILSCTNLHKNWISKNRYQYVQTVPKLKNGAKDLDSKTKIARLSQYEVLRTCEPPPFLWKCESRRHSTTSCRKNVVEAKTSYQMLGILSFSDQERALPHATEISELKFLVKKVQWCFPGVSIFRKKATKLQIKCRSRSRLRPGRSKAL